jgi:hypothetical protein
MDGLRLRVAGRGADVIFAVEPLQDAWDEVVGLARKHWNETQGYRHNQPFNPVFERYNQYAKAGWYLQFTVRDEGRLVGYGGAYIVPSMHTQRLIAQEDTWYLLPEYRRGLLAVRFFRFMEEECVKRGAEEVSLTVPEGIGTGVLCERLGYRKVAVGYSKQISPSDKRELASEACDTHSDLARADSAHQPDAEPSHVRERSTST